MVRVLAVANGDGGSKEADRRRSLNVMDSTVTASFEEISSSCRSDRCAAKGGVSTTADDGERKIYVA
jgi:hypothetical protein